MSTKVFDTFLVQWKKRLAKQEIPFDKVGKKMKEVNPIYIPRNHLIERAISNAYEGDLMEFHKLCNIFTKPFKNQSLPETYFKRTTDDPNIKNTFCGT
jgi:serine/tyrosine/threonine adenylyltransferase